MSQMPKPPSVLDVSTLTLAGLYAQAALDGMDDSAALEFVQELEALVGILDSRPEVQTLLTAATINKRERIQIVERVFTGRVSPRLEAFLAVLARHERLGLLRNIARQGRKLLNARQGKIEVTVTTAVELDQQQRQELEQALSAALKAPVLLDLRVDETILGGLTLRLGDKLLDASIAAQLRQLARNLAARKASATPALT